MGKITEHLIQLYYANMFNTTEQKKWTTSVNLAISITKLHGNKKEISELKHIYHNTNTILEIPLAILEDIYQRSHETHSKMKSYRIGKKEVHLHEIISALSDSHVKTTGIVTQICKRLNVDIPFDLSKYGNVINK